MLQETEQRNLSCEEFPKMQQKCFCVVIQYWLAENIEVYVVFSFILFNYEKSLFVFCYADLLFKNVPWTLLIYLTFIQFWEHFYPAFLFTISWSRVNKFCSEANKNILYRQSTFHFLFRGFKKKEIFMKLELDKFIYPTVLCYH